MEKLKNFILNIEKYISVALLFLMLVGLTYQTVARYLFKSGTTWMEEMCGYGLLCLVFISASYATQHDTHMRVDSVTALYPKKLDPWIRMMGDILWLLFTIFITVISGQYVLSAFKSGQRAISIHIPLGIFYSALPIGYGCMSIRLLVKVINDLKKITGKTAPAKEGGVSK